MKSHLSFLLHLIMFHLVSGISQGQTDTTVFAPKGATWSSARTGEYMIASRDTFIQGHDASVIEKHWTCGDFWRPDEPCSDYLMEIWDTNVITDEIVYSDGSRVYYYIEDSFYLLYDFAIAPGETMTINARERLGSSEIISFEVMVDDVDIVDIDGTKLRAYHIIEWDVDPILYRFNGWVTERFGKELYPFPYNNQDEDLFGFPFTAQCYEDDELQNAADESCFVSTTEFATDRFTIFPNPSISGFFQIDLKGESKTECIRLFDHIGRLVKSIHTEGKALIDIQTQDLLPGYYMVSIDGRPFGTPVIILDH